MNNLSNQEIARVFAMYYFAECTTAKYPPFEKGTVNTIGTIPTDADYFKLLLTPLTAITDEHAIEVAKIISPVKGKLIATKYNNSNSIKSVLFPDNESNYTRLDIYSDLSMGWVGKNLDDVDYFRMPFVIQYLISKGYAVPLFFDIGHPDNGKDAIQLGLAISTLHNQTTQP